MSNRLIQYGFTAGIVSNTLWSQTILQKYGWGLADCKNYLIDFSGMLVSRGGLMFDTVLPFAIDAPFRLIPFVFAEEDANTFQLLFVEEKIYFLQQGRLLLEDPKSVTAIATNASYTEFTSTSHGYAVGDFIEFYGADVPEALVGQTVRVSAVPGANTFRCTPLWLTDNLDDWADAATAAVSAYRVYSLASDYAAADLPSLYFDQSRDVVDISHIDYPTMQLEREADGTWTLTEKLLDISVATPTGLSLTAKSGTSNGGVIFAVTAVGTTGEESLPTYVRLEDLPAYDTTAGWVTVGWDATAGAVYYNVYRSSIAEEANITMAAQVGFVGRTVATNFHDRNIIPDFTQAPPTQNNPFSNGTILSVELLTKGSGYARTDTVAFTDGTGSGSGATGNLLVDEAGKVVGIQLINGGKNYETPVATIATSGGSGATFDFELSPETGNYPRTSTTHQQRKVFASSQNEPLTVFGSQIGLYSNFTRSRILADNDSYEYELSFETLGIIKHLVSTRAGLLAFSNLGVWQLAGSQAAPITPSDIDALIMTTIGSSDLRPLKIDSDILYAEVQNRVIRLLQYNHYSQQYGGQDISVLARDLFAGWNDLVSWSFEARPYRVVWATRNDGGILTATISQEQEVFAWSRHDTAGNILANITVPESAREVTYCVVERYLSGRWVYTMEHFADRAKSVNSDHCGVDCAVQFGTGSMPAATLSLTIDDETAEFKTGTFVASSSVFTAGDVDKYIQYQSGKALITAYVSGTEVDVEIIDPFVELAVPYSTLYRRIPASLWRLVELQDSIQLPLNMRPSTVAAFGDGKTFFDIEVDADGTVTFPEALAFGYVGFSYDCVATTLPFAADGTIIEDSRKNVKGVGLRFVNSKGIEVGTQADDLYPIEHYFHENLTEATRLRSDHEYVPISSDWEESVQIFIKANGAVPTQITGLVVDLEVGDDVD